MFKKCYIVLGTYYIEGKMNKTIFLTDSAQKHFSNILKDNAIISLGVTKSGCSGFSYEISIKKDLESNCHFRGIPFFIDDAHIDALNNLIIDYKKDGLNYKIVFDNPNSINECGCGESFSLKRSK